MCNFLVVHRVFWISCRDAEINDNNLRVGLLQDSLAVDVSVVKIRQGYKCEE